MTNTPIEDYALLSNRHGAALVSRCGTVDWLSLPRFDSPSIFGSLLDADAGFWSISLAGDVATTRRYVSETLALESKFESADAVVTVTDCLTVGDEPDPHKLGHKAPMMLVRVVTCVSGSGDLMFDYQPRPEYGSQVPQFVEHDGSVIATSEAVSLTLSSSQHLDVSDTGAQATFTLRAGQSAHFAMQVSLPTRPCSPLSSAEIEHHLATTIARWRAWSQLHQRYEGPWQELVCQSGRVLQALSYEPSGAIVAAATTSLPEEPGGQRNWDYRYTWIRDSAFTMDALWVAACPDEASQFFSFMTNAARHGYGDGHIQIMYGVGGELDLPERELPRLSGWRDSRPVRIGNGAASQHQLDVYGELLATAARFEDQLDDSDHALFPFLTGLAETAARVWREPDNGIWEIRGEPRHFLYSKLMCWVALDRAVLLANTIGATARIDQWAAERDNIRAAIESEGWSESMGAFRQSFDTDALDAAALMMPIVGFIDADDPRMCATIDAIAERLTDESGLVYRYRTATGVDGLAGKEGTFLLCTFWLSQALALAGRVEQARDVFERAIVPLNDVGLLAEQVDPETGALWGNFPQAFSHIGLVNAAAAIADAEVKAQLVANPI